MSRRLYLVWPNYSVNRVDAYFDKKLAEENLKPDCTIRVGETVDDSDGLTITLNRKEVEKYRDMTLSEFIRRSHFVIHGD